MDPTTGDQPFEKPEIHLHGATAMLVGAVSTSKGTLLRLLITEPGFELTVTGQLKLLL